jgi:tubulin--tyrosine ligase
VSALKVYVYKPMLALFAAEAYTEPGSSGVGEGGVNGEELKAHLTNTCLQSGEREGSVHAFWDLPSSFPSLASDPDWRNQVFAQVCASTSAVFEAAARSMSVHFQPLPTAFEVYGLDFMVDEKRNVWLLEVNAFPDFGQTGTDLEGLVGGLFEEVVRVGVKPFLGLEGRNEEGKEEERKGEMVKVLDVDLGRR